jgi:YVTN family beta-propeller protein
MVVTLAALVLASSASHEMKPFRIVDTFHVGGEGGWDYLTVDSATHRLFVSRSTRIDVIDTQTGKVIGMVKGLRGTHQAVIATGHKGYTSNGGDASVTVFDDRTYNELKKITVGEGSDAIIFDKASGHVFTFNGRGESSSVIDVKTDKVVATIPLGGKPEFPQVDGKGHLFFNNESTSEVVEIDTKALKITRKWSIAPGEGPSGLAIDLKHHHLFSVTDTKMVVSDYIEGKVVDVVTIGDGPDAAAFDPSLGLAWASCGDGTLTAAKLGTDGKYSVFQTVKTAPSARTCTLDPKTHRIYLAAAEMNEPAPGERRGRMKPNSFEIIVVGQ